MSIFISNFRYGAATTTASVGASISLSSTPNDNLFQTAGNGADQDWTSWASYGNTTYWSGSEMYLDSQWGNVARFTRTSANDSQAIKLISPYYATIAAGETYTFSVWVKSTVALSTRILQATFTNAGGTTTGSGAVSQPIVANQWKYITIPISSVTTAMTGTAAISLSIDSFNGSYQMEFAYPKLEKTIALTGTDAITAYGFIWSTTTGGTTALTTKSNSGSRSTTGSFSADITGLTEGTLYYITPYYTTSAGTTYAASFAILSAPTVTAYGHVWSTSPNPTTALTTKTSLGTTSAPITFNSNATGLSPGTMYYVRTYVTTKFGTTYGPQSAFTTKVGLTDHGFVMSTSNQNPTLTDTKFSLGARTTTGSFSGTLATLAEASIFYVRSYATTPFGTTYGESKIFETTTLISQSGYVWSTTNATPTLSDSSWVSGRTTPGVNSYTIPSLPNNTAVYIRSFATTRFGTVYSATSTLSTYSGLADLDLTSLVKQSGGAVQANLMVNSLNGSTISDFGIVYSRSAIPTTSDTTLGYGAKTTTGAVGLSMGFASPSTLYYVRAYATTPFGTTYSPTEIGITSPIQAAEYGHVLKTSAGATVNDTKINLGAKSTTGSFSTSLTGLTANTTYYTRAYSLSRIVNWTFDKSSEGWGTGNTVTFTYPSAGILRFTSGISDGQMFSPDNLNLAATDYNAVKVRIKNNSTNTQSQMFFTTTTDTTYTEAKSVSCTITTSDADYKEYLYDFSGNAAWTGTIRRIRFDPIAIAGNVDIDYIALCEIQYGTESSFKTLTGLATVTTGAISSITYNTASAAGTVTALDGENITAHGHVWGTSTGPTTALSTKTNAGARSSGGTFNSSLTSLNPSTTYYVRSYATTAIGTTYGSEVSFSTASGVASYTTSSATGITGTSASLSATVSSMNTGTATQYGFVWSTSAAPTTALGTKTTVAGSPTVGTAFTYNLTGLSYNTQYYVRAYVVTATGTAYTSDISVKTLTGLATLATVSGTATAGNNPVVTLTSTVSALAGENIVEHGHVWATTTGVTLANGSKTTLGTRSTTGNFVSTPDGSNFAPITTYYYKGYATTAAGTTYTTESTFTTLKNNQDAPIDPVITALTSTSFTATSSPGSSITAAGTTKVSGSSWTGLTANTAYTAVAYFAGTTTLSQSPNSATVNITTPASPPALSMNTIVQSLPSGIVLNGILTNTGGVTVSDYGFCWGTTANPTTANSTVSVGTTSAVGLYTSTISNSTFTKGTTYYFRGYATNSAGTSYSSQVTFTFNGVRVASLKSSGDLQVAGGINEKLPAVSGNLVAQYTMDGPNGLVDNVNGLNPTEPVLSGQNILETLGIDWRDPASWSISNPSWTWTGGTPSIEWDETQQALKITAASGWKLNKLVAIDPAKQWYIEARVKTNKAYTGFYMGDISYNINKTTTTQHPGTYEWWGAQSKAVPTSWIALRNDGTGGVARTGTSATSSVLNAWDTNMYYIAPTLLANYSNLDNTYVTWVSDLKLYYTDANTSPVTITDSSVSIEEATTNLLVNPTLANQTGLANTFATYGASYDIVNENYIAGTRSQRLYYQGTNNGSANINKGIAISQAVTSGTTYAVSFYGNGDWERISPISWWSSATFTGVSKSKFNVGSGWYRYMYTFTATATATITLTIRPNNNANYDFNCLINAPQLEAKAFATSFVAGTRSTVGALNLPLGNTGSDWTVFVRYVPDVKWSAVSTTSFNKRLFYLYDRNTGKRVWQSDYLGSGPSATSTPWVGFDDFLASTVPNWHWHGWTISMDAGQEYWFALTKSGSVWSKYAIYNGGYVKSTVTQADTVLDAFTPSKIQFPGEFCSVIKDTLVYDRALTEDEIKNLGNGNMSMKSSGTLSTQVREGAIGIPKTADLYPLSFNEKDFDGIRGAMMVINPTFNNGSMWLGTGYQNLWQQPKSTTFSVQSGSGWELVAYTPSEVIYKKNHTGTGGAYKGWDIAITAGTTYTYSADIFVSEDFNGNSAPFMNNEQNSTGSLFYDLTKLGTWQTVSRTFTATVTGNCRCLIYPCAGSQTANKGYTMYRNVSFTATAFPVPFSYGSPTDSQLKYHLDSIVTSSMDWTVGVWTKPNTYHVGTNPSNEFVALSIGDTGMPGQGDAAIVFKWNDVSDTNRDWTLVTFNNEVDQSSAKVTMTAADLAGWILCVIRYNVSEGQLYGDIYGATGKKYSTTASNLIPAIVPYVDPGASQWDAYFRDLFTEARFITDAELDKIAKTNMRASKDRTTQVQGNIIEWRQL